MSATFFRSFGPLRGVERGGRIVICPLLSGPKYLLFWIMKELGNAVQEAQAGRDHRQAA